MTAHDEIHELGLTLYATGRHGTRQNALRVAREKIARQNQLKATAGDRAKAESPGDERSGL
jgi:hypothetical protein